MKIVMRYSVLLSIVFVLLSLSADAVTIRSHGTLNSCVVTMGKFCPVESLGVSLAGTFILMLVFGGIKCILGIGRPDNENAKKAKSHTLIVDDMPEVLEKSWKKFYQQNKGSEFSLDKLVYNFCATSIDYMQANLNITRKEALLLTLAAIKDSGTHEADVLNALFRDMIYGHKQAKG